MLSATDSIGQLFDVPSSPGRQRQSTAEGGPSLLNAAVSGLPRVASSSHLFGACLELWLPFFSADDAWAIIPAACERRSNRLTILSCFQEHLRRALQASDYYRSWKL